MRGLAWPGLRLWGAGGRGTVPAAAATVRTPPVPHAHLLLPHSRPPAACFAVYNNSQTLNLQRFILLVAQQLRKARRQVGGCPGERLPTSKLVGHACCRRWSQALQFATAPAAAILLQGGGSTAVGNAVYCLRTIIKDLMEQLNSEQLLAFIEVPPEVAAAAAAAAAEQQQHAAVAAAGTDVGSGGGSGGSTPTTTSGGGGQAEFAGLHNGSLVQTLVRAAMQTLSDPKLL